MPTDPTGRISHIDEMHRGQTWKRVVRVATTANVNLSSMPSSVDGVTLAAGDRFLAKDQTTGSQNGIYDFHGAAAAATRAYDMDQDSTSDVPASEVYGAMVVVAEGTANAGTLWRCTNTGAPTLGTTTLTFAEISTGTPSLALDDLTDVNAPSPSDGDALTWDAGTSEWVPSAVASGGSSPYFDIRDYGAVIDGSTDDLAAWNAAVTAAAAAGGGTIFHPGGISVVSGSITITDPHVSILGVGNEYGPSIIKMTAANTTCLNYSASWADDSWTYHASIRNLLIIGPGTTGSPATSGRGIYARSHINIENVGIVGFYDGLYWDDRTFYSRAYGLFVSSCAHAGIVMLSTNNCTLDTCRIFGDDSRTAPTVAGRRIFGSMQYGVFGDGASGTGYANRVVNSSIEYFTKDGINLDDQKAFECVGNYFETQQSSSGFCHVVMVNCDVPRVEGNYFQGDVSGMFALSLNATNNATVIGNRIGGAQALAITSSNGAAGCIEGNNHFSPTISSTWPASTVHLGSIPSDPTTAEGDLIYRHSGAQAALAIGAAGRALVSDGTDPAWTAAGGDVTGAYSALTVGKLQGRTVASTAPTSGQTLAWDGSQWTPTTAAASGVGALVIADSHSTPLVFGDLLQNEAQDDLIYADP